MVKDAMSIIVNNPKLSMSSSKISLDIMEGFFILTIDNEYAKSALILQSLLKASADSIGISCYSSCWRVKNLNSNIESDKSELEVSIKLEDEMNQDVLICQIDRASS